MNKYLINTSLLVFNFFLVPIIILVTSCDQQKLGCTDLRSINYDPDATVDDGSCDYGDAIVVNLTDPDAYGNLVVNNFSEFNIHLYCDDELIKTIEAGFENYVIDIPNNSLLTKHLKVWKAEDVNHITNPDLEQIYRQWKVALSNTYEVSERATWNIFSNSTENASGTVIFTYPNIDEYGLEVIYSVDIYKDNKTGAKLASLLPGVTNKQISIEYGLRMLYYKSWFSDPVTGDVIEIGWDDPIEFVINDAHHTKEIVIPIFESYLGKYGIFTVMNESEQTINVKASGVLMDEIVRLDGSSQGISLIDPDLSTDFLIPIDTYIISVEKTNGTLIAEFPNITINQKEASKCIIGREYKNMTVHNQTDNTILFFDSYTNEYIGLQVLPNSTISDFKLLQNINALKVLNIEEDKYSYEDYSEIITINN